MPYDESTVELVRNTLLVTLKIALPILAAGVVIGLVISILQSVTQIQDQAIAFVPKIIAMMLAAAFLIPWIVQRVIAFSQEMFLLR